MQAMGISEVSGRGSKHRIIRESGTKSKPDVNVSLVERSLGPFRLNLGPDHSPCFYIARSLAIGHVVSPREV